MSEPHVICKVVGIEDRHIEDYAKMAEDLVKRGVQPHKMNGDQLAVMVWYYDSLLDGWQYESPQSANEVAMWEQERTRRNLLLLEVMRRRVNYDNWGKEL